MYVIVNILEKKAEQFSYLKPLLQAGFGKYYFFSSYEYQDCNERVVCRKVQPRFPKIPFLRGIFRPFVPYFGLPRLKPNVLLIHDEIFSSTMVHAIFAKLILKSKVMVHCAENAHFSWCHSLLGFFFARFVDCGLGTSHGAMEKLKKLGVKKTFYCPLAVEDARTMPRVVEKILRVGLIGRLVKEKGILLFCEAMRAFPELEWKVYGSGYLERAVKHYDGLYRGTFEPEQLDDIFSGIDLLVVPSISTPSWKEQFGRVIAEAMARGVLVIGSNSGSIPEVIGNSRLIFEEKSSSAIVEKIRNLLSFSPAELRSLSQALRQRFEGRYSPAAIGKVFAKCIKEVAV